ncbi:MAG: hypothetical protein K6T85_05995, partial [Gorillibacterium sp.]|nr:hypothetical protein [Gorillibacterium sp.]
MLKLDFDKLEKRFSISLLKQENAIYSVAAIDLLKPEEMRKFVDQYAPLIKALDATAVAAYFAGWFANVALALQYSVSVYNTALDLSLANLTVELVQDEGYAQIIFCLDRWQEQDAPANDDQGRVQWLNGVYADFYGETVKPLFTSLSAVSGLPIGQLWGQFPTKLYY